MARETPENPDVWARRLDRGLLAGAAVIVGLALLGGVLTQSADLRGQNALHLQLEYFAVFAAVSIFFLSSAKYAISRERIYLPLGLGFLSTAIFDLLHPLFPSGAIPATTAVGFEVLLQDLNGYLWWMGRITFGIGFLGAALAYRYSFRDGAPSHMLLRGLLWTLAQVALFAALVILLPLPSYYGAGGVFPVMELVPLLLYAFAMYFIGRGSRHLDRGFRVGGLVSLALGMATQGFAALSRTPGDALFFAAHAFKITSFLVVLFGLYLEHVSLYARERRLRETIEGAEREALQRRAELFAVIENTADGMAILDPAGRLMHLNQAALGMLGNPKGVSWIGTPFTDHLEGDARELIAIALRRALEQGYDSRDLEIEVEPPGRARLILSVGLVPLRDASGALRGAVAGVHDVTSLREAERRYRELTEGAPDPIIEMRPDGTIAFFNRAAQRAFGYAPHEVVGKDVAMLMPERFRVQHQEARRRFFETGESRLAGRPIELVGLRRGGREFAVELTLSPAGAGPERAVTAIVRDVQQMQKSRRERAGLVAVAEAVTLTTGVRDLCRQAADGLRAALGYDAFGIFLKDPRAPFLRLVGLGAEGPDSPLAGAAPRSLRTEPPEPSLAVRAFRDRQPVVETGREATLRASPRAERMPFREDSLAFAVPVLRGEDVVAVCVGATSAVRHSADEELPVLKSVALQLAIAMGQKLLFEELRDTARSLSIANRELDAFIYTASHDLAEPLRSMSNFSQFLVEDHAERLEPQARDYVRRIHEGALRMRALLDALLQVSRIRHKPLPFERVDTRKILEEVRESLDAMIKDRKGEVVARGELPSVYAQPQRVMEVFNNLVSNGLKFNESGTPRVEVSAESKDGFVEFTFRDNGIGIPAKYQDRVFGLFARLHPRGQYPGTGAGLAIVRTIIEQHGGEIRLESKEGEGTQVVFTLPREPPP